MKRVSPYVVGGGCGVCLAVALLIAITKDPANRQTPAKPSMETPMVEKPKLCVSAPDFDLTPTPPVETLLHRWKRTKADYDRQSKAVQDLSMQVYRLDTPAFEAYQDAEKELQTAQCGKVCVVEKAP